MPIYEYRCSDCHQKFDLLTSYATSESGVVCTHCQSPRVRKLISVVARPGRGDGDDFGGFDDYGEGGDDGDDFGGGCSCGGACSCNN